MLCQNLKKSGTIAAYLKQSNASSENTRVLYRLVWCRDVDSARKKIKENRRVRDVVLATDVENILDRKTYERVHSERTQHRRQIFRYLLATNPQLLWTCSTQREQQPGAIDGNIEGRRARVRSPTRWTDQIKNTLKTSVLDAFQSTQNTEQWRRTIRNVMADKRRESHDLQ